MSTKNKYPGNIQNAAGRRARPVLQNASKKPARHPGEYLPEAGRAGRQHTRCRKSLEARRCLSGPGAASIYINFDVLFNIKNDVFSFFRPLASGVFPPEAMCQ
jgi:hypothetical protein